MLSKVGSSCFTLFSGDLAQGDGKPRPPPALPRQRYPLLTTPLSQRESVSKAESRHTDAIVYVGRSQSAIQKQMELDERLRNMLGGGIPYTLDGTVPAGYALPPGEYGAPSGDYPGTQSEKSFATGIRSAGSLGAPKHVQAVHFGPAVKTGTCIVLSSASRCRAH